VPKDRPSRNPRRWATLSCSASALVLLWFCVGTRRLDRLDRWAFDRARPHDVWGPSQIRSSYLVDGLRPPVMVAALGAVVVTICLARRRVRPAVLAGATLAVTAAATQLVRLSLGRQDPHGRTNDLGGSFPSGHTVAVVVCVGIAVWVLRQTAFRWSVLVSVAAGIVMGTALVIEGAHWASDVVGGLLLGVAMLSAAKATGLLAWSARSTR
jgi:membrane-associated phospholipid phosphatase